jgi:hypothetical protein
MRLKVGGPHPVIGGKLANWTAETIVIRDPKGRGLRRKLQCSIAR